MASPKRRAVYDEFLKVPAWKVAEIIDGELIVRPRPAIPHAHTGSVLGAEVLGSFNGPPGSPAAGGSSSSPSCISARTSSSRTSPDGAAIVCRCCRRSRS